MLTHALIPLQTEDDRTKSKADEDLTTTQRSLDIGSSTNLKKPISAFRTTTSSSDIIMRHSSLPSPPPEFDETNDDMDFPEGGLEANLVVIGAFSALLITFGMMNTVGVMQAYISEHILPDASASSIGWIFSVFFFFAFGGGIYAGPLFDFKGAKIPMYLGSTLMFVGLIASANCTEVYQFVLAYGVVFGAGTSFLMNCSISAVSHYFLKKRGSALGICSIAGSLGGVIWPLMLRSLFPKIGYVWTMRILAFISIGLLLIGCLLVKHRITKKVEPSLKKMDFIRQSFVLKDIFTDKIYFSLIVSIILSEFCLIIVLTYISSYTMAQGYSESNAFLVTIALNGVGIIGRYLPNYAADRVGNMNIMCVCAAMCSIMILVVWLPFGKSLSSMFVFAALYGFFSSSTLSLTPVCCGQISRTEDFGKRYGTIYFIVAFTNLISLPIGGAIVSNGSIQNWNHLIIFAGVIEVVSTAFWCWTRYLLAGTKICKV
uniref:MFS transporter n=1 Tax=Cyberlindnera americana TaxID=36016 RepID=A0A5P8N8H0_9ASCO|nr:MFS transporter [Cyberlindnera americana]